MSGGGCLVTLSPLVVAAVVMIGVLLVLVAERYVGYR